MAEREDIAFLEWQKAALGHALQLHTNARSEATMWGLETAKHLALSNLTGLTGALALISAGKGTVVRLLPWSAISFAVAGISCVAAMWFYYRARTEFAKQMVDVMVTIQSGSIPPREAYAWNKTTQHETLTGNSCAWAGLLFTVIGGVALFFAIL